MNKSKKAGSVLAAASCLSLQLVVSTLTGATRQSESVVEVLWRNPVDIASRNLFYGSGGSADVPLGPFVFLDEDLSGTNPKFHVRDRRGIKWQVKLGLEARPETAASRLIWAVGYQTDEYYFMPEIHVENLPVHWHRRKSPAAPGGTIRNVRLKRHPGKKEGLWHWHSNPFVATREYNGLRVMMALVNDWDLKDDNNSIYLEKDPNKNAVEFYLVSDLGATFGSTGRSWPARKAKGNLGSYSRSTFIRKITPDEVDFGIPTRPALLYMVDLPAFIRRMDLRWIGKHIPRSDACWIGTLLATLSVDQIRDAFRAAGYTPSEVEGFTRVVRERIAELNRL